MGYQESLIYIQPQEQVGQIVKEYLMARQQDPQRVFLGGHSCRGQAAGTAERLPGGFRIALGSGRAQQ